MSQLAATRVGIVGVPSAWLVVYGGLAVFFLHLRGMYSWQLRLSMLESARKVIAATALAAMTLVSLRILLPGNVDNLAPQTLRLLAFSAVYLTAGRIALDWAQLKARRLREDARPTLVVGAGRIGSLTARRLLELPELGLEPVGFVDKEPLDEAALPLPVLGASWDLERLIEQHGIEHVVVTFSTAPSDVLLRQIKRCEELGVSVSLVPRLFEKVGGRLTIDHIGGLPLLSTRQAHPKGWQFALKYIVDRLVAGALLADRAAPLRAARCSARCSRSGGRCSSASRASAATATSSRCSSSARCARRPSRSWCRTCRRTRRRAASRATTGGRASAPSCGARRWTSCRSC